MKKLIVKKISFEPEFNNPRCCHSIMLQTQTAIRSKAVAWELIPKRIPEFYRGGDVIKEDCIISLPTELLYFEWDGKLFRLKRGEKEITQGRIEMTQGGDLRSFSCTDEDGWRFLVYCMPEPVDVVLPGYDEMYARLLAVSNDEHFKEHLYRDLLIRFACKSVNAKELASGFAEIIKRVPPYPWAHLDPKIDFMNYIEAIVGERSPEVVKEAKEYLKSLG